MRPHTQSYNEKARPRPALPSSLHFTYRFRLKSCALIWNNQTRSIPVSLSIKSELLEAGPVCIPALPPPPLPNQCRGWNRHNHLPAPLRAGRWAETLGRGITWTWMEPVSGSSESRGL